MTNFSEFLNLDLLTASVLRFMYFLFLSYLIHTIYSRNNFQSSPAWIFNINLFFTFVICVYLLPRYCLRSNCIFPNITCTWIIPLNQSSAMCIYIIKGGKGSMFIGFPLSRKSKMRHTQRKIYIRQTKRQQTGTFLTW